MRKELIAAALILTAAHREPTAADIGPQPIFSDAVAMTERAIRDQLDEPASAQFEWPYDFTPGSLKARSGKPHVGWIACGRVTYRDRTGANTGPTYFEVVIHNGSIETVGLGTRDMFGSDFVGVSCERLIQTRFLRRRQAASNPGRSARD